MKKLLFVLTAFLLSATAIALPKYLSYQAVIRNTAGELITNQTVGVKVSLFYYVGTVPSGDVYVETHSGETNENGLLSLYIGRGDVVLGVYNDIEWGEHNFCVKTEIDPTGGTDYSITSQTSLMSVPYAFHAKKAETLDESSRFWSGNTGTVTDIGRTGNVGIGVTNPEANLHVYTSGPSRGNVLFEGYVSSEPVDPPASGRGTRMMWYPDKAAFRAGYVRSTRWEKDSIGEYSVAMGLNTKASGQYAVAFGEETTASGNHSFSHGSYTKALGAQSFAHGDRTTATGWSSFAMGEQTEAIGNCSMAFGSYSVASGLYSVALGRNAEASGEHAMALGHDNIASGQFSVAFGDGSTAAGNVSFSTGINSIASGSISTAMGGETRAPSYLETALGSYNTSYAASSPTTWELTDRLFSIGNGTYGNRSNALTILKNGNTGIGIDDPGGHRLNVLSDNSGSGSATCRLENSNSAGLALFAHTNSSDGTALFSQEGSGYSLRCDGYDPDWFVAMIVKGRKMGINTSSPTQNLDVNGNARIRNIASGAYAAPVNRTVDGTLTTATSDIRLKENVKTYQGALGKVMKLRGVSFTWKKKPEYGTCVGFIAQEMEQVIPELVFTNEADGYKGVNYAEMTAVLVEALKELKAENDRLKAEKDQMVNRIEKIEAWMDAKETQQVF